MLDNSPFMFPPGLGNGIALLVYFAFFIPLQTGLAIKYLKVWNWLFSTGIFSFLLLEVLGSIAYMNSADDEQIMSLVACFPPAAEYDLCCKLLLELRDASGRASMTHWITPLRNSVNGWMRSLPQEYMDLLQSKEPWALVMLAHFCVLIQRSETVWFMEGHGVRLMLSIIATLDEDWSFWIQWPCQELGLQLDGSALDSKIFEFIE